MAVVPMQKVRLMVHATNVDEALDCIQRFGALEFRPTETENAIVPEMTFEHAQLLPRVQHAVQFLDPYFPKVGLWQTLREGTQTVLSEADVTKKMQDTDVISTVVDDLEKLQVEFTDINEKIRLLSEQQQLLTDWKSLPVRLSNLKTTHTSTVLVSGHTKNDQEPLRVSVERLLVDQGISHQITEVSNTAIAVTVLREVQTSQLESLFVGEPIEIVAPPQGTELPEIELTAVSEELAAARGELALLHDQAEHFAITHNKALQVASEVLSWQKDRFSVVGAAVATKHTVVFEGWLNKNKRSEIESEFANQSIAASFNELEQEEGEEPPVEIDNPIYIKPFEAVTRLYGMPGYKDLDPTVFLAGFFFLFFGMSLTDVGYGLFLMVVSVIILTLFKVAPPVRMFAKLLLFVGFATVLVGLLFGGYLGIAPEYIPDFLKKLQVYDPIGNPLPVFYTALGLGVIQVMTGMAIKIYSDFRNGKLMGGILDQGPWLFVFCLGILYIPARIVEAETYVGPTIYDSMYLVSTTQLINLIYVGIVMIVLSSARKGEGIFGRIQKALLSLYDSIGYFSDILSYSRLLALGLATTALAFAVNLIASMVVETPYVGYILAGVILVVGHLFTLAVNTLGAFIHSARLQFVEFFGKFIDGTGKQFTPLSRTEKYVTVKKE